MTLARVYGRAAIVVLLVIAAWWLLQLSRRADLAIYGHALTEAAGGAPADTLTSERQPSRLVLHLDRGITPAALVAGWSASERNDGVWSMGHRAELKLGGLPAGAAQVTLTAEAFLPAGLPAQRVTVRAQGRTLSAWRLTTPGFRELALQVPADARAPNGDIVLQLDLPDADSPARRAPGATDGRVLAVKLKRVEASVAAS